jgi:triosephosphate isomerase
MRKPFIAGNWKMNTTAAEAVTLAAAIAKGADGIRADLAVCPPFVYLNAVADAVKGSLVAVGAQDVYFEPNGAFTGEISTAMLKDIGSRFVIVGHSERRHVLGEPDDLVNRKLKAALAAGIDPILCVGETLEERDASQTMTVVERHVRKGLADVGADAAQRVTIAYEPVWAIGTGRNATPAQAQEVHREIRAILADMYDADLAGAMRIQYGGSVKPDNAGEILAQPDVDGALVGGASLKADSFLAIARAAGT